MRRATDRRSNSDRLLRWRERQPSRGQSGRSSAMTTLRQPRRERLVEPQVVPPRHRHVVAEPHVRDLVRGDAHEALLEDRRHLVGTREQELRRVGDEARVLHRAAERRLADTRRGRASETDTDWPKYFSVAARIAPVFAAAYAASAARPFGTMIEIGVRLLSRRGRRRARRTSPTANATRYDGSGGVRWKLTSRQPAPSRRSRFDRHVGERAHRRGDRPA